MQMKSGLLGPHVVQTNQDPKTQTDPDEEPGHFFASQKSHIDRERKSPSKV